MQYHDDLFFIFIMSQLCRNMCNYNYRVVGGFLTKSVAIGVAASASDMSVFLNIRRCKTIGIQQKCFIVSLRF